MSNPHFSSPYLLAIALVAGLAASASAEIVDGIDTSGTPRADVAGTIVSFEPPTTFINTLPAASWINKASGIKKLKGGAGVLESSSFAITGLSAPNILVTNCVGVYADGETVPQLPETISLSRKNSSVSLNVATTVAHSGKSITITAKGGGVPQTVVLSTTMQTVTFTGTKINKITIEDTDPMMPACLVVIDDIQMTPEP